MLTVFKKPIQRLEADAETKTWCRYWDTELSWCRNTEADAETESWADAEMLMQILRQKLIQIPRQRAELMQMLRQRVDQVVDTKQTDVVVLNLMEIVLYNRHKRGSCSKLLPQEKTKEERPCGPKLKVSPITCRDLKCRLSPLGFLALEYKSQVTSHEDWRRLGYCLRDAHVWRRPTRQIRHKSTRSVGGYSMETIIVREDEASQKHWGIMEPMLIRALYHNGISFVRFI